MIESFDASHITSISVLQLDESYLATGGQQEFQARGPLLPLLRLLLSLLPLLLLPLLLLQPPVFLQPVLLLSFLLPRLLLSVPHLLPFTAVPGLAGLHMKQTGIYGAVAEYDTRVFFLQSQHTDIAHQLCVKCLGSDARGDN